MTSPIEFDHPSILKVIRAARSKDNKYLIRCDRCGHEYSAGHSTAIRIQKGLKRGCNKCTVRTGGSFGHATYPELVKAAEEMAFVDSHWRIPPSDMFRD